ncbi:MAG: flavodoxin family protein [Bacteroides sp.]|jgi:multimeric flavodoxin WrbA|nr:flavodoxin family protein [Bacteroides sp.]
MKVLIINGSPRKQGNISKMLDLIGKEVEACGAEVSTLRVNDLEIHPCMGCMSCRDKLQCCLPEDDAQRALKQIVEADALVIGAPCYWGNMPGQLKLLFDRIVYGMMGENSREIPVPLHKGKKAVVVSTCTTPYPFNIFFNQSRGVVRALKEILKWSGFKMVATLEKAGTKKHPALTKREETRCRKIAYRLI